MRPTRCPFPRARVRSAGTGPASDRAPHAAPDVTLRGVDRPAVRPGLVAEVRSGVSCGTAQWCAKAAGDHAAWPGHGVPIRSRDVHAEDRF
jgi:hypothetical protein